MTKFVWQNGSLVSKAKVEINDTVYEVEPEEYYSETPLSAENLNAMQDDIYEEIESLTVPMIKATMDSVYTVNENNVIEKLPLTNVNVIKGEGLSLENGSVKIGKNINYVLASANVYWYQNINGIETLSYIYKNENNQVVVNKRCNDNYEHTAIPSVVIPVQEGDVLSLRINTQNATSPLPTIQSYETGTFLTVVGFK